MDQFLGFYLNLAQEGETMLVVEQKPKLEAGKQQFHRDGALKCTWPASKYNKRAKYEGKAIYGNTGIFINDRMNGKISAGAANCEYVAVMVLDDIGTKSKKPNVKPTWRMETSEGNEQWGYVLDPQPPKGEYAAAIIAIAAAGYTDKGAINPVRNFRLPGSVNLKPTAGMFESKLIEFDPTVSIDLAEFCAMHDIKPAEASTASHKVVDLFDDGNDDVMAWLAEQGQLLAKTNGAGWAGVVCPNASEHTDGNPEGRYNPVNRAYSCLHAHCCDWNSERYLTWVEEQGGPSHQTGLRSDLLVATLAPALARLESQRSASQFNPAGDAEAIIQKKDKEQELRELARIAKESLHEHYAYIEDDDAYFSLDQRRELSRTTFNAMYRHLSCTTMHGAGTRRIEASVWFDENRFAKNSKSLAGLTYAPGETMLCARDGLAYGNRWVDARPDGVAGADVSPWLKHMERLIPEKFERDHLMQVMAYKVQHPEVKVNHAVLMAGAPGCGKDSLFAPFFYAVSGPHEKNKSLVDGKSFDSQFNYGLESEIMVINELRPDQSKDRRALENTLKPIIAAPPEFLTINRKNQHPYQAVNRLLVVAFSNFRDAIALPSDDRRWFCLWSEARAMTEAESNRLWRWYRNGGMDKVAGWLKALDVSAFNAGATPPMTEAKQIMLEQARSSSEEYVIDALQHGRAPFDRGVIGAPFHKLLDILNGGAPDGMKIYQGTLMHALTEAGWVDMGRCVSRKFSTTKRVFCTPSMKTKHSKSELRDMIEEVPKSTLAAIVGGKG